MLGAWELFSCYPPLGQDSLRAEIRKIASWVPTVSTRIKKKFHIDLRNEMFSAISVNKGYHSIISELVSPEGPQEGMNTCHLANIRLQPLPMMSPEETQDMKTQETARDTWGAYQKNNLSEFRLLHFPTRRKALNSLTWDTRFSLVNNHLFDIQTICPLLQKFYILWLRADPPPPPPPWSSSLRVT